MSHPRPQIMAALIAQLQPLLPDVTISWGLPLTNAVGDYLYIGLTDPSDSRPSAGRSDYLWPVHGRRVRESSGSIACAVESAVSGDGDAETVAFAVHALFDTIASHLHENPTLGVPGVLWLAIESDNFIQAQTRDGAFASIEFQITYTARAVV